MIPSGWEEVRFESICESMSSGGTPSTQIESYWTGTTPWITGADFGTMKIAQVRRYITEEAVENSATKVISKGDILLVTRTGVGKMAIAPFDIAISQDTTGIIPKRNMVDTNYLLWALMWSIPQLVKLNQGTSINGVTRQDLKKHKIMLPPLAEQRRIAEILGAWDEAITLTQRLIEAKQRRKKGLMQRLLTGSLRLPGFEGKWGEVQLESICESMSNGGTPSTQIENYWTGTIPWITGADFGNMKIVQVRRYITEEAVENSATKVISKGDILLVTRTGVGKMAIAPFDIAISQDTTGIIPKRNMVDTNYLLWALVWTIPQLAKFNQGTSINGVTRQDLKKHRVSLPPPPRTTSHRRRAANRR